MKDGATVLVVPSVIPLYAPCNLNYRLLLAPIKEGFTLVTSINLVVTRQHSVALRATICDIKMPVPPIVSVRPFNRCNWSDFIYHSTSPSFRSFSSIRMEITMFDRLLCSCSARCFRYSSKSLSIRNDTNVVGVRSPPSYSII